MNVRAGEPFRFWGCTEIRESLGVRAESERQLMERLETVPTESVYYHTVRCLLRHQVVHGPYPDDFSMSWADRFVSLLRSSAEARSGHNGDAPPLLPVAAAVAAYARAARRMLLLDYDGTLVSYAPRPPDAEPSQDLLTLLGRLAADPRNLVALVSGRPRAELEKWFAAVRELWLVAEHGALIRSPQTGAWQTIRPFLPVEWKARVIPVLEHFADRTPGSLIEEKEFSLVWHHRMADPEFGDWLAHELVSTLDEMLAETELHPVRARKSIEVKLAWANKSEVAAHFLGLVPDASFRLGIGDDRTDEDLFERLGGDAWTVHVGEGPSRARYRLPGPGESRALLTAFLAHDPRGEALQLVGSTLGSRFGD